MPEIAEVERARSLAAQYCKGKTIVDVEAFDDPIVFKDCTANDLHSKLSGRTIRDVKRWGKYFWLEMDKPPHVVMHFGMTGWLRIKDRSTHWDPAKDEKSWPPRYVKFILTMDDGEAFAFVDARRLGRVRLVDADDPQSVVPLKEQGFDPIYGLIAVPEFTQRVLKRKVPIKALLLDQTFSAGVGNWVADEILFQAKLHPEQYANTFSSEQIQALHSSMENVCRTAVDVLADPNMFPEHWLMMHRWGKGKKPKKLPSGEDIKFITVGGRTSAVVPSVQKKTGPATISDQDEDVAEPSGSTGKEKKEKVKRKSQSTAENGVQRKPKKEKVSENDSPRRSSRRSTMEYKKLDMDLSDPELVVEEVKKK